jgi:WD40 repeat protein
VQYSAHTDFKENCLLVANLHDGVDLYSVPSMQLVKTYSHGNANNAIFKVSFIDRDWLVSGGQDSFARLYHLQSGQLVKKLKHTPGGWSINLDVISKITISSCG